MSGRRRVLLTFFVLALLSTACEEALQNAADGIAGEQVESPVDGSRRVTDAGGTGAESAADVPVLPPPPGPVHATPALIGVSVGVGADTDPPTTVIGDRTLDSPGAVLENVVVDGCLKVRADNVTIRNVEVRCDDSYPIKVENASGTSVLHSRIDCRGNPSKGIYFRDSGAFTVDSIEISGCDDQLFVDGGTGTRIIRDSVFHQQAASSFGGDGVQLGSFAATGGRLVLERNWWGNDGGESPNSVLFLSTHASVQVNIDANRIAGDAGLWLLRCNATSTCLATDNVVSSLPASGMVLARDDSSAARCNVLASGELVPDDKFFGATVDNAACGGAPPVVPADSDPSDTPGSDTVPPDTSTTTARPATTTTSSPATTTTARPATTTTVTTTTTAPPAPPPPPPGSFVTPAAIGSSVGAWGPSATHEGSLDLSTPGQVFENTTVNGCITIEADNVTVRNVVVNCYGGYPIKDEGRSGTRVERVTIDCLGDTGKGIYFQESSNFVVDRIEIRRCDDQFFIDGGLGSSRITNSVFHDQAAAGDAHTDGMQVGTFEHTSGTLVVDGNWWEYDRAGCCDNGVLFLSSHANLRVEIRDNYLDHEFGTHVLRCRPGSDCLVERNTLSGVPDGYFFYSADGGPGLSRCNRMIDGSLVPQSLHSPNVTVDNSAC